MASISGLGATGSSSIYGNKNVISGLASGMDTEAMIENSVSGYQQKILALQKEQQMTTWKQDAYRSIIDKMYAITQKYTSYSSTTNLFSASFFNKAVATTAGGANASKVSATGKSTSAITIDAVRQLAAAAKYSASVKGTALENSAGILDAAGKRLITTGGEINWDEDVQVSDITGTMTLTYGNKTVDLSFGELDAYTSAEELKKGIEDKLSEVYITTSSGDYLKANQLIDVNLDETTGEISFSDKKGAGNSVYISGASSSMKEKLGIEPGKEATSISVGVGDAAKTMSHSADMTEYLSDKTISVTLDGVTKKIKLADISHLKDSNDSAAKMNALIEGADGLQAQLDKAFGKDKINVSSEAKGNSYGLSFNIAKGSVLAVGAEAGEKLGLGENGLTSYLNTSKTLGDLGVLDNLTPITVDASKVTPTSDGMGHDEAGNLVKNFGTEDAPSYQRVDANGNPLYEMKVNGTVVGNFSKDTALESVLVAINSNTEAGVNVSYSKITNQFVFTAKETGAAGDIVFDSDLGKALFGDSEAMVEAKDKDGNIILGNDGNPLKVRNGFTAGQDAIFNATINGESIEMKRSSNVVDMDGMSVTLQGTFGYKTKADGTLETEADGTPIKEDNVEPVTFTTTADSEKIVGAIKSFVEDYNALVKEIREGYATLPAQKSNGARYEPLSDEDKASMSESAVEAYEEKVKQGLLFGDSNLSTLYSRLRSAITPGGNDGADLRVIGITTTYDDGLLTLSLDENKLKDALKSDPDKVRDTFTKSKESGSATNGLMYNLKKTMDAYASTSVAEPGILVRRAGTKLSSLSLLDNTLQKQLNDLDKQIESWQDKMSDKVDYYTRQFTALEQLMSQMNSQSASLASMMGGY